MQIYTDCYFSFLSFISWHIPFLFAVQFFFTLRTYAVAEFCFGPIFDKSLNCCPGFRLFMWSIRFLNLFTFRTNRQNAFEAFYIKRCMFQFSSISFFIIWVVSIFLISFLSLISSIETPIDFSHSDLLYHMISYIWLSILPFFSFTKIKTVVICSLLMIMLGISLEFGQGFIPGRFSSVYDMVANTIGVEKNWNSQAKIRMLNTHQGRLL